MKNLLSVEGRMRRKHYWLLWLSGLIANLLCVAFMQITRELSSLALMFSVLVGIFIALQGVKRMHDTDHSGWFLLVPVYNLILLLTQGTWGDNRYGKDPKDQESNGADLLKDVLDAPTEATEIRTAQDYRQGMIYFIVLMGFGYFQSIISRLLPMSYSSEGSEMNYYYFYGIAQVVELILFIYLLSTVRNPIAKTALTIFLMLNIYFTLDFFLQFAQNLLFQF